jgi:Pentapeptide repeats (8 copies)
MSDEQPQRPLDNDDRDAWRAYWQAQGMRWRTEPEIGEERQRFLTERRAVEPDIEQGIYPFKGLKLQRGDVEWLLATHDGGLGPVNWHEEKDKPEEERRWGLDLRGADLSGDNLSYLPLARLRGGQSTEALTRAQDKFLEESFTWEANRESTERFASAAARFDDANLKGARLEGASLILASLEKASLVEAHLEGADLSQALLNRVDLRRAFFDETTQLAAIVFWAPGTVVRIGKGDAKLGDIHWGNVDLTRVHWFMLKRLGEERVARTARSNDGKRKPLFIRREEFSRASRAYRQLANVLRAQGVNGFADYFAYKGQRMQRSESWWRSQRGAAFGSWLLDLVSGYGYRPMRSFITYALVVLGFAAAYFAVGSTSDHPLTWNEAVVISMTAFHGRGFFTAVFQPGDLQAAVAAVEAFIGLLIEITFIATFTQRFLGK